MQPYMILLIVLAGGMLLLIGVATNFSGQGSLNGIKSKTVGDGQHGTAHWANKKESGGRERTCPKRRGWYWAAWERKTPSPRWWIQTISIA